MMNTDSSRHSSGRCLIKGSRTKVVKIVIPLLASFLCGCPHFQAPRPTRVDSSDQAGSVRVAAATVSLWSDVSSSMKPNFALTGDQAAAQVLPITETIEQQVLTAFGAGLSAGFPQTSASSNVSNTNSAQSTSSTASGVTSTTATTSDGSSLTTTKQSQSGTAPALPTGTPANSAIPPAASSAPALGMDPVLKYKAANHLFQEVQLLNQEITDAADRQCFVPYVIGLKIAFMNYRPHLAYSLHEHIGFFFGSRISNNALGKEGDAAFIRGPEAPPPSTELAIACRQGDAVPEVIPLLVTDDIQVAVKARAAEAAQQIAAALSFMTHGVGVGANLNAVKQSLESIQNHDLSSSLTVGRDTGSSLYVEVAANNTATGDPALVSQTYDIPVLLLVPRSYFGGIHDVAPVQIAVTSVQQFRDASSGKILPPRPYTAFTAQGAEIIESYLPVAYRETWKNLEDGKKEAIIAPLYSAAVSGTMRGLVAAMKQFDSIGVAPCLSAKSERVPCIATAQAPSLWTAMGVLGDDANRSNFVVQLPLPTPITVPGQQALLADDGESPLQVVLGGVGGRSISSLAAQLRITPYDLDSGAGRETDIWAQTLALDPSAHTLTLSFPSLKKLGISCLAPTEQELAAKPGPSIKDPKAADPPKCPSRAIGAGSSTRPNLIALSLVGCDPHSQLCPELTQTTVLSSAGAAVGAPTVASSEFKTPGGDIGVTLIAASSASKPAKIKVTGGASNVCIEQTGRGTLLLSVSGTPAQDTGAITIDGATVISILDSSTNAALPFGKTGYTFAKDGQFTVNLINLTSSATVSVAVQAFSGKAADGGSARLSVVAATNCSAPKLVQH